MANQQLTPETIARMTPEQTAQLRARVPADQQANFDRMVEAAKAGGAPAGPQECVFCKISKGEAPAKIVAQDELFMAVLDIQPRSPGHTVIIPKRHVADFTELTDDETRALSAMEKLVAEKLKQALNASGYSIICPCGQSAGQALPHLSVHLIPTYDTSPLPIMGIIQPAKVPEFVGEDVAAKLGAGQPPGQESKQEKKEEFYFS